MRIGVKMGGCRIGKFFMGVNYYRKSFLCTGSSWVTFDPNGYLSIMVGSGSGKKL